MGSNREKEFFDSTFFDNLSKSTNIEDAVMADKANQAKYERLDHLIHKVFQQSDDGQELLNTWCETLMMTATAEPGQDMISIGINEGMKRFIRSILLTIKKVEES